MLKPVLEIIYVFTKGVGWTPEVIREDVRHAAKRVNFGGMWVGTGTANTLVPLQWRWGDFTR